MSVTLKLPPRNLPWTAADAAELAERVRDVIIDRTRRGIDAKGKRFKTKVDGSPSYLEDSGRLLRSIEASSSGGKAVIEARVDYAQYVGKDRPFLGLTKTEERKLRKELEAEIAEKLGGIALHRG